MPYKRVLIAQHDPAELQAIQLFVKNNYLNLIVLYEDLPHKIVDHITTFIPHVIITGNIFQARPYAIQFAEFANSIEPRPEIYLYTTEIPDGVEKYFPMDHVIAKFEGHGPLKRFLAVLSELS